jgi:hypothetical protein
VHDLAPVTSVLRFDPPHPDPPRRGMAESFSTRVRGIESVQARLAPISGWEGVPMVTLTKATEGLPVKDLPIHVEVALEVGEDHKDDFPDDPRTEHQLGAIHLYTQGWAVVADSLYAVSRRCAHPPRKTTMTWDPEMRGARGGAGVCRCSTRRCRRRTARS